MSIAETIKAGFNHSNDWDQLFNECKQQAQEIDQDWENGNTQYNFVDGSCIVISGSFVNSYNSQK